VVRGALWHRPGAPQQRDLLVSAEGGIEALPRGLAADLTPGEVRLRARIAALGLAGARAARFGEESRTGSCVHPAALSVARLLDGRPT